MGRRIVAAALLALGAAAAGCAARATPMERGLSLYDQGYYAAAASAFDEAVRQAPDSPAAYTNRGVARIRAGDVAGAIADFTRAHELDPRDPEVLVNRGNAHLAARDAGAAIGDYTEALVRRPEFVRALFNRGIARAGAGDAEGARADWTRAIELERDPDARAAMVRAMRLLPALRVPPASAAPAGPGEVAAAPPAVEPASSPPPPAQERPARLVSPRELANRGLDRELGGDRAGALEDLRAALAMETDPAHRAGLENLIRLLEASP